MELGSLAQLGSFAIGALALAISIYGASRKGFQEAIKEISDRAARTAEDVAELSLRLTSVEREMQHLPSKEVAHSLQLAIAEVKAELGVLAANLKPVAAISDRLQEFLLDQARGGR